VNRYLSPDISLLLCRRCPRNTSEVQGSFGMCSFSRCRRAVLSQRWRWNVDDRTLGNERKLCIDIWDIQGVLWPVSHSHIYSTLLIIYLYAQRLGKCNVVGSDLQSTFYSTYIQLGKWTNKIPTLHINLYIWLPLRGKPKHLTYVNVYIYLRYAYVIYIYVHMYVCMYVCNVM
jgi:hypothetical protein